jgi:hypothetical protein
MAEKLLNGPEIGTPLKQVGGERVTEGVRTDPELGAGLDDIPPNQPVNTPRRQASAPIVQEERLPFRASGA